MYHIEYDGEVITAQRYAKLKELNAELLEACKQAIEYAVGRNYSDVEIIALLTAAIAKAEGK